MKKNNLYYRPCLKVQDFKKPENSNTIGIKNLFCFFSFFYTLFITGVPTASGKLSITGVPTASGKQDTGDFHICYFSLNNEKEFTEMKRFTDKLNQNSKNCSISVEEYMTEGGSPEASFKKMLESGASCDGLVISGHHTGSFGGKRSSGSLGIDFLEKLSCDKKYSSWFNRINALWLQGCRTLGTGEIVAGDREGSADHHTTRVGAVLEADHLTQSFAELNVEFSATLDQDNPLSSRYLRAFPSATVFGWTKTAPGEKAGSQLSIPFHMAHTARLINNQDAFPSESPTKGTWTQESSAQYMSSLLAILNNQSNCEDLAVKAWKDHGKVRNQSTEYGFYNPDLNAYTPIMKTDNTQLNQARVYNCRLQNSKGEELLGVLDSVLKDERLIRYTYNSLFEKLKNLKNEDQGLHQRVLKKLRGSEVLGGFLNRKLSDNSLGVLRKIDYLAFYEEIYGEDKVVRLKELVVNRVGKAFGKIPSNSFDEIDYKMTILTSLSKHGFLKSTENGLDLLKTAIKDPSIGIRRQAINSAGQMGERGLPIVQKAIKDESPVVRSEAAVSAGTMGERGLPILQKAIKDESPVVRRGATNSAGQMGERGLPIVQKAIKDENPFVRREAINSAGRMGERGLPIVQKAIKDESPYVRRGAATSAGTMGERGLSILQEAIKDEDVNIRAEAAFSAGNMGERGLPIVQKAIKDESPDVRERAAYSAGDMGERGLPIVQEAIKDKDVYVRKRAAFSAGKMGERGLPILQKAIKDESPYVRRGAAFSARRMGERGLPILQKAIKDEDVYVRREAAVSAEKMGERGLPILREALSKENDPSVINRLKRAIRKLENGRP